MECIYFTFIKTDKLGRRFLFGIGLTTPPTLAPQFQDKLTPVMDMINFNTLGLLFYWLKRVVRAHLICYNQPMVWSQTHCLTSKDVV
jgi:hypothetical protein